MCSFPRVELHQAARVVRQPTAAPRERGYMLCQASESDDSITGRKNFLIRSKKWQCGKRSTVSPYRVPYVAVVRSTYTVLSKPFGISETATERAGAGGSYLLCSLKGSWSAILGSRLWLQRSTGYQPQPQKGGEGEKSDRVASR